ncbi:MAG TPA: nucleoside-triphosphatase [Phycisphaerae bacterium]|nr:nucleoside-triphosphatase [Phycisphaerae bacterium]
MDSPPAKVVLWVGPKHSGKTTALARLVEAATGRGFAVAGLLAPAIYRDDLLAGFDAVDVATGRSRPLARWVEGGEGDAGRFTFHPDGLDFGRAALGADAVRSAALVVVDEFGPLELRGAGWRVAVDGLLAISTGTVLLVVREELSDDVARLYARWAPQRVAAGDAQAIDRVLKLLGQGPTVADHPDE